MEMFVYNAQHHMQRKQKKPIGINYSYQLSRVVVEGWWLRFVLEPQDMDIHEHLCIAKYSRVNYDIYRTQAKACMKLVMQENKFAKHTSIFTEWLKKKRVEVF